MIYTCYARVDAHPMKRQYDCGVDLLTVSEYCSLCFTGVQSECSMHFTGVQFERLMHFTGNTHYSGNSHTYYRFDSYKIFMTV